MRSVERPFTVYVASFVPSDFPRLCSCEMSRVLSGIFSRNSKCIVKWHFVACFEFLCFNAIWCVYVYNLLELLLLKVLAAIKHVVKNGESKFSEYFQIHRLNVSVCRLITKYAFKHILHSNHKPVPSIDLV